MKRLWKKARRFGHVIVTLIRHPVRSAQLLSRLPAMVRAMAVVRDWRPTAGDAAASRSSADNPLRAYFDGHQTGPGIYKWLQYFDAYHTHLHKFVGRDVHVVEIGVFSGGSLLMWQDYFGERCRISGVDLEEACRVYENDNVHIYIGDQEDRGFWRDFSAQAPPVDVLLDDGGHTPEQQMVTLEEMLPRLRPGGVYICEDIHGRHNRFAAFAAELAVAMHQYDTDPNQERGKELRTLASGWQADIESIHVYPFAVVIVKRDALLDNLVAPRHGTEWQAFKGSP